MIKLVFGRGVRLASKVKVHASFVSVWVGAVSVAGLLLYLGVDSFWKARSRLSDQATSYAHLIAEHDKFGFTLADVILRDIADNLTIQDFTDKPLPPARHAQVLKLLQDHRNRLPGIASFTLIGADGIRRIGVVGKDFTDLSDRGYFIATRDGQPLFISNVEDGRASGKPGIHVARRFNGPDGSSFGGTIELNLAAQDVFFSYYKSMNLGKNSSTTLRDPKRILISYPHYQLSKSSIEGPDPMGDAIANGDDHGLFIGVDPADGLEKVTAWERLSGTNFYASASLATGEAMAESHHLAIVAVLAATGILLGALAATSSITRAAALGKARDDAMKAGAERTTLIRALNTIVEDERKSISVEIHDVLNAIVLRIRMDAQGISTLAASLPDPIQGEISQRANSILQNASDLYDQGRSLVTRLRPEVLDVLGLDEAVDEMVSSYNDAHPGCRFTMTSTGDLSSLDNEVAIASYRLVQEALSNVVKHAKASVVTVSLRRVDSRNRLEISVCDNGIGFDPARSTPGVGLIGMRERVTSHSGQLVIRPRTGGGTEVRAYLPLGADKAA